VGCCGGCGWCCCVLTESLCETIQIASIASRLNLPTC
jgi:hypothetical protein